MDRMVRQGVVLLLCAVWLCVCVKSNNQNKKLLHIHKHDDEITSVRSSNIVKEEGHYFLRQIIKSYSSDDKMDLVGLKILLEDLGFLVKGRGVGDHESGHRHRDHHNDNDHEQDKKEAKSDSRNGRLGKSSDKMTEESNEFVNVTLHRNESHTETHLLRKQRRKSGITKHKHGHKTNSVATGSEGQDSVYQHTGGRGDSSEDDYLDPTEGGGLPGGHGRKHSGNKDHNQRNSKRQKNKQMRKMHRRKPHGRRHGNGEVMKTTDAVGTTGSYNDDSTINNPVIENDNRTIPSVDNKDIVIEQNQNNKRLGRKNSRQERAASPVIFHSHDVHTACMSVDTFIDIFHVDEHDIITTKDLLYFSPAIVYQLSQSPCRHQNRSGYIHGNISSRRYSHGSGHHQTEYSDISTQMAAASGSVWGYSALAVLVISLVGLLGVAIVPIMQKVFYEQLIQFLVALAVGALTGDALLHLLPHAISVEGAHDHDENGGHDDQKAVWKGLCALMGIYVFFIIQSILKIVSQARKTRREKKNFKVKIGRLSDDGIGPNNITDPETADTLQREPLTHSEPEESHGHSHNEVLTTSSVSSVAWMVILGDGIHNFSDGMAIGAAFASSTTGGISTAIAVFCHELPHEIGDFAVLLKAGMSIKQAVIYNVVSSVLCFFGMVIGVVLGNIENASTWIFAGVGGMFIYISLVTMVPELTSTVSTKPLRDLFLQICGLCSGSGIMLLIAVYESELKIVLD